MTDGKCPIEETGDACASSVNFEKKPSFRSLDYEQSLLFFRFSEGSASERERRAAKPREARNEGRSHARGHLRISHVLLDGPRKKRDWS